MVVLAAAGCSASVSTQMPRATLTLRPYLTPRATSTMISLPEPPTSVETPRPTATLFTHTIQKDETLLLVAARYGITLEMLLAANPGINPRLLSIGQQLTIPGPEGGQLIPEIPTTTPVPVHISEVACYPTLTGRQLCLASVTNRGEEPVEGIAVRISVLPGDGRPESSAQTYTPLNLLPPGQTLPVWASFSIPSDTPISLRATLLSAIPAAQFEERYAEVALVEDPPQSSIGKTSWTVSGHAETGGPTEVGVRRLVILAIGFDSSGAIVGFAESVIEPGESAGGPIAYKLQVFSLGPPITEVRVIAEASLAE